MAHIVDTARNSFIANVNLLIRKLNLLIELNEKFSEEDIKTLVELAELDLNVLIQDMLLGDASVLRTLRKYIKELTALYDVIDQLLEYGKYFEEIRSVLDELIALQAALDKLVGTDGIYDNLDKLIKLADGMDTLPETLEDILNAVKDALDKVNELKNLSIAVIEVPYGQLPSGNYNVETGMLTLGIPEGKQGEQGLSGRDGLNGIDGKNGKDGKSAYELFVESGYNGSFEQWKESLKGDPGKNGIDGVSNVPGPAGEDGVIYAGDWPLVFGEMSPNEEGDLYLNYAGDHSLDGDFSIDDITGQLQLEVSDEEPIVIPHTAILPSDIISADADNAITLGNDSKIYLNAEGLGGSGGLSYTNTINPASSSTTTGNLPIGGDLYINKTNRNFTIRYGEIPIGAYFTIVNTHSYTLNVTFSNGTQTVDNKPVNSFEIPYGTSRTLMCVAANEWATLIKGIDSDARLIANGAKTKVDNLIALYYLDDGYSISIDEISDVALTTDRQYMYIDDNSAIADVPLGVIRPAMLTVYYVYRPNMSNAVDVWQKIIDSECNVFMRFGRKPESGNEIPWKTWKTIFP